MKIVNLFIFIFYYYNNWFIFSEEISRNLSHLLENNNLPKKVEKNLAEKNDNSMIFKLEQENQETSIINSTKKHFDENKFSTMFLLLILSILINIGLIIYYITNHKTQSKNYLSQLQQLKDKNNKLNNDYTSELNIIKELNNKLDTDNCNLRELNESLIKENNDLKKNNNSNKENSSLTSTENGNIINKKQKICGQSKGLNMEIFYAELQNSNIKQEIKEFLENLRLQIEALQQENDSIEKEKGILKDENKQLNNKNKELINFINANQDLKNLRDENQKLNQEIHKLIQDNLNIEKFNRITVDKLQHENQELNEEIYSLHFKIDKLEENIKLKK